MIQRLTPLWRLRATLAALLFPPLISTVSMERIAKWIARARSATPPDSSVDDRALAEWVDRVLRRLPPPWRHTCLRRAVPLHYLLHRAGRPAELRIGVRRNEAGALAAHAWLTRDGKPYLEPGIEQIESFQVLTTFSTTSTSRDGAAA
jgi:Transglutaminase-like superfamily